MEQTFRNKNILVTGGTGSIGREIVKALLKYNPRVIRVFDYSESSLFSFQQEMGKKKNIRFFLGDIKDIDRLKRAAQDVDVIFHTAGLKHVALSEYNPFEAVKTNVIGTQNVIEAALSNNVEKVIFTSSDKAVNPTSTMGATKLVAEKLMVSANFYRGKQKTAFSNVRFGNVIGTSGSVIPVFLDQIKNKLPLTITHKDMTRFFISLQEALELLFNATRHAQGGETFIMKMPAIKVLNLGEMIYEELTKSYGSKNKIKIIGTKPGEKLYEELMTEDEAKRAIETQNMFIILPNLEESQFDTKQYNPLKRTEIHEYRSDRAPHLKHTEIKKLFIKSGII